MLYHSRTATYQTICSKLEGMSKKLTPIGALNDSEESPERLRDKCKRFFLAPGNAEVIDECINTVDRALLDYQVCPTSSIQLHTHRLKELLARSYAGVIQAQSQANRESKLSFCSRYPPSHMPVNRNLVIRLRLVFYAHLADIKILQRSKQHSGV